MKAVTKNGEITFTKEKARRLEDVAEIVLKAIRGKIRFTKSYVMILFGLNHAEATAILNLLLKAENIFPSEKREHASGVKTPWSEPEYDCPEDGHMRSTAHGSSSYNNKYWKNSSLPRKLQDRGYVCSVCGTKILGWGKHGKSKRGHTREECDLALVKNIYES